jgi:hypothetical protein
MLLMKIKKVGEKRPIYEIEKHDEYLRVNKI